jgi:hypothetical protein
MCEAHYLPGGCAHGFDIKSKKDGGVYKFDAGPSLWAGMSQPSTNPLRQVMDAVGANVEWKEYNGWGVYFPDGYFRFNVGPADAPGGFEDVLRRFGGPGGGLAEWKKLGEIIKPLILSCTTFPPMALRADPGVLLTLRKQLPTFLSFGPVAAKINGPFSSAMEEAKIKEGTFLWRWLDYLSFALSGLLADGPCPALRAACVHKPPAAQDRGRGRDHLCRGVVHSRRPSPERVHPGLPRGRQRCGLRFAGHCDGEPRRAHDAPHSCRKNPDRRVRPPHPASRARSAAPRACSGAAG